MKLKETFRRWFIRWDRRLTISKRQQFVFVTLILGFGLMLTQLVTNDLRYPMTLGLSALALSLIHI